MDDPQGRTEAGSLTMSTPDTVKAALIAMRTELAKFAYQGGKPIDQRLRRIAELIDEIEHAMKRTG
jgi:hypothetical protein